MSPPALDRHREACLAKDPDDRRQNAGDLRRDLRRIAQHPAGDVADLVLPGGQSRARLIAIIGAVALTGALAGFAAGHRRRTAPPAPDPIAFTLAPPPGARFRFTIEEDGVQLAPPVVSPDGRRVVFGVVDSDGIRRLLIRDLDNIEKSRQCREAEGTAMSFLVARRAIGGILCGWKTPDARLQRRGGRGRKRRRPARCVLGCRRDHPLRALAQLRALRNSGGRWNAGAGDGPRHDDSGCVHRWPMFLPDGEHFVLLLWTNSAVLRDSVGGIYVGSTRNRETRRIVRAVQRVVRRRRPFFRTRAHADARAADLESLTLGTPVATGDRIDWDPSTGLACFSVSPTGTLTLRQNNPVSSTRLVWFDRTGAPMDSVGERMSYQRLAIARDSRAWGLVGQ